MIPVVRSKYVNLEVHFQGKWKVFTCERFWNQQSVLQNVCKELNIPLRERDQLLPNSVELFLVEGDQATKLKDFEGLNDGQKVLVEVKTKKAIVQPPPKVVQPPPKVAQPSPKAAQPPAEVVQRTAPEKPIVAGV